jgi:hypothetical protein
MKAKYIGDPRNPAEQKQLPDEFEAFGLVFERGKFTDIPDKLAAKFEGNSHYATQGDAPKA